MTTEELLARRKQDRQELADALVKLQIALQKLGRIDDLEHMQNVYHAIPSWISDVGKLPVGGYMRLPAVFRMLDAILLGRTVDEQELVEFNDPDGEDDKQRNARLREALVNAGILRKSG